MLLNAIEDLSLSTCTKGYLCSQNATKPHIPNKNEDAHGTSSAEPQQTPSLFRPYGLLQPAGTASNTTRQGRTWAGPRKAIAELSPPKCPPLPLLLPSCLYSSPPVSPIPHSYMNRHDPSSLSWINDVTSKARSSSNRPAMPASKLMTYVAALPNVLSAANCTADNRCPANLLRA
jgi:hypothetical protein